MEKKYQPTCQCKYHCKCMNLDKQCPNPHYMDKNCKPIVNHPETDCKPEVSKCCGKIARLSISTRHGRRLFCELCGSPFIPQPSQDLTPSVQEELSECCNAEKESCDHDRALSYGNQFDCSKCKNAFRTKTKDSAILHNQIALSYKNKDELEEQPDDSEFGEEESTHLPLKPTQKEDNLHTDTWEVVPSGRIDYCSTCKKDHGYDCPDEWINDFDEKFPKTQKEPTHYQDVKGKEDCKCWSCNDYRDRVKQFISLSIKDAYEKGVQYEMKRFSSDHLFTNFIDPYVNEKVEEARQSMLEEIKEKIKGMNKTQWSKSPRFVNGEDKWGERYAEIDSDKTVGYNIALSDLLSSLSTKENKYI